MKPYTLEWWMDKLDIVTIRYYQNLKYFDSTIKNNPLNNHHRNMCVKYLRLSEFISNRIINKYGE